MKIRLAAASMIIGLILVFGAAGADDYFMSIGMYHSTNYVQIIIGLILMIWPTMVKKYD